VELGPGFLLFLGAEFRVLSATTASGFGFREGAGAREKNPGTVIYQRTTELGSPRDVVRNPEEHSSFMESPYIYGLSRMVHENQREPNREGRRFAGQVFDVPNPRKVGAPARVARPVGSRETNGRTQRGRDANGRSDQEGTDIGRNDRGQEGQDSDVPRSA
jgi:hypothetical protein